jgi:hypothetical protein
MLSVVDFLSFMSHVPITIVNNSTNRIFARELTVVKSLVVCWGRASVMRQQKMSTKCMMKSSDGRT